MCDTKNIFNLNSQASSNIQGNLLVTDSATINGNETIEGNLTVEQVSNLNGNVNIGGDISVSGSLSSIKDIQVFGTLYSYGNPEFRFGSLGSGSGTLNVLSPNIDITTNLYYPTTTTSTDTLVSVNVNNNFTGNNTFSGNSDMGVVSIGTLSINGLGFSGGTGTCYYGDAFSSIQETYYYQQFGNMITLFFPGISTTAGFTSPISITGLPESYQTNQVWSQPIVVNNSGLSQGVALTTSSASSIGSNGSTFYIYIYTSINQGNFTEGNTVGFNGFTMSFFV